MDGHLGERLSACVDGELAGEALAAAEHHLATCSECRAAYDALLGLRRRAAELGDRPPERDLWPGVAARIAGGPAAVVPRSPRRRRIAFSVPQLAAAAVALMAVSAGGALLLSRPAAVSAPLAALTAPPLPVVPAPVARTAAAKGVASYDVAIRDLEAALAARSPQLDTATVRAVRQSLAVIDAAIRQAEAALAQDPNSLYLNNHLEHALDRKLELLRRVTTLAAAS